jgi:iron(III) transport system substrate-binding protein
MFLRRCPQVNELMPRTYRVLALAGILVIAAVSAFVVHQRRSHTVIQPGQRTLVLYCATDREIAQDLIDGFQRETGIRVQAKYDTEAAKAVGLVQAIRQEKSRPQCDVTWGGGPFFCTILANDNCLAQAPADLIAAQGSVPHDPQGRWLGFAAAYRVLIVNTDVLPDAAERPHSFRDLTDPKYKGHVGIANPLFGGMNAHVAALVATLGEPQTREWLQGLRANNCAICAGMADVKNRVASGELWFGITSTIDAHVAMMGGKPVTVIFPDQGPGEIGCLNGYNAVAKVANCPHPKEADAFLRYLLTTRTEKLLASGPGQNVGMLPQSIVEQVRPAWIPSGIRTINVDWSAAVAALPATMKAIHEILLDR